MPTQRRILVVDDSPIDRKLAANLLTRRANVESVVAANGVEALRLVAERCPDLVLTDLQMPELNGLELVTRLRQLHPQLPVVLMTAHGSERVAMEALRAGAADYVPKQALARELVPTVTRTLNLASSRSRQLLTYTWLVRNEAHFELGNDPEQAAALVHHQETLLRSMNVYDESTVLQVAVALREAIHNAIYHGNLEISSSLKDEDAIEFDRLVRERSTIGPHSLRRVQVVARHTRNEISYQVTDDGPGFDPSQLPDPLASEYLERAHGRGLLLIHTFMDEVHHNAKGNQLSMTKRALRP